MAIFKDKTGRGEVNYAKSSVQGSNGTVIKLDDATLFLGTHDTFEGSYNIKPAGELLFQLRGEPNGVTDVSSNSFSINEVSGTLTKRIENVTHNQKLKTFEFSGQVLTLTASLNGSNFQNVISPLNSNNIPGDTYLPYVNSGEEVGKTTAFLSCWVYLESLNQGSSNPSNIDSGGSCILESVDESTGKRSIGLIVSSQGEIIFRYYDWTNSSAYTTSTYQQIKTVKKLSLKKWYHITVIFFGYSGGYSGTQIYNTNGLDQMHPMMGTAPTGDTLGTDSPQVEIYIDSKPQPVSEHGNNTGTFSGGSIAASNLPFVIGSGLGSEDNSPDGLQSNARFAGRLSELSYFVTYGLANAPAGNNPNYDSWKKKRQAIVSSLHTGIRQPASGITNVSERLLLRDLDQNSTHPTVKRSGDQRRLGNHLIQFDDSRAQTLKGATVHYPTKLVEGDNLIDTIYGGYFNGDLALNHTASVESYDTFYRREDQPAHKPFVESRIYIDSGSSFYQTGTLESVLPGFDRPLRDKEFITIDLDPTTSTEFGFTGSLNYAYTGTSLVNAKYINNSAAPHGADVYVPTGSLMMYWNENTKKFEKKGRIISAKFDYLKNRTQSDGSVGDAITPSELVSEYTNNLCTGFSRIEGGTLTTLLSSSNGGGYTVGNGGTGIYEAVNGDPSGLQTNARPISTWGFPFASKYEQESNGTIKMSNYINEPFLLEKIVYEFSASFEASTQAAGFGRYSMGIGIAGTNPASSIGTNSVDQQIQHHHYSFFILRQFFNPQTAISKNHNTFREDSTENALVPKTGVDGYGTNIAINFTGSNTSREMLGYGQVFISYRIGSSNYYDNTVYQYLRDNGFGREINIEVDTDNANSDGISATGSYRMEFSPSVTPQYDIATPVQLPYPDDNNSGIQTNLIRDYYIGGRGNPFDLETRSLAKTIIGKDPTQTGKIYGSTSNSNPMYATTVDNVIPQTSPYILMPEDELIFGWNAPTQMADGFSGTFAGRAIMTILPNKGKVTFFGSFLKNSQKRQFQLNQLLNNDIVHEAIGQEPISDQFDIEPRGAFTGSYVDEVMSGSTVAPYNGYEHFSETTTNLARRIAGRSSEGTQGVTGSLRRTLSIASADKTEYDSFLFDLENVFAVDDKLTDSSNSYNNDRVNLVNQPYDSILLGNEHTPANPDPSQVEIYNRVANIDLGTSFLFNRYHSAKRVRFNQIGGSNSKFLIAVTGSDVSSEVSVPGYFKGSQGVILPFAYLLLGQEAFNAQIAADQNDIGSVAKFFFARGGGSRGEHNVLGLAGGYYYGIDDRIRGFRYGLSNLRDRKPKNVFRRDRYGQLRDMLEMAPNTAYVDDISNTISYPVEAQFFADDGSTITPDATSCSNLSTYVTSSAPFFDREVVEFNDPLVVRNRGPLNNKVADITIEI